MTRCLYWQSLIVVSEWRATPRPCER